jgi:hypothetical protein
MRKRDKKLTGSKCKMFIFRQCTGGATFCAASSVSMPRAPPVRSGRRRRRRRRLLPAVTEEASTSGRTYQPPHDTVCTCSGCAGARISAIPCSHNAPSLALPPASNKDSSSPSPSPASPIPHVCGTFQRTEVPRKNDPSLSLISRRTVILKRNSRTHR